MTPPTDAWFMMITVAWVTFQGLRDWRAAFIKTTNSVLGPKQVSNG
jgi:hypothetical protein